MSPRDLRTDARSIEPGQLLVERARVIDLRIDRRHDVRGVDWRYDVGEDEAPIGFERVGDPPEKIGLAISVEMMHRQRRNHEVERPFRQRVLQIPDEHADSVGGKGVTGDGDHSRTPVDSDELRLGVAGKNSPGRLARPDAKFENRFGARARGGHCLIFHLVVARHGLAHHRQVALRREAIVPHGHRTLTLRRVRSGDIPGTLAHARFVARVVYVITSPLENSPDATTVRPVKPLRLFVAALAALPILVVLGAGIAWYSEAAQDVDREAYVQRNHVLLNDLPRFPRSQVVRVEHWPTSYQYDPCCGSFISGYVTATTYQSPQGTTAAAITRFYESELPRFGWRKNSWGKFPAGWPRVLKGHNNVMQIGYRFGDAGASVSLLPFIRGNRIVRGGRFIISVDHGGYRPLP